MTRKGSIIRRKKYMIIGLTSLCVMLEACSREGTNKQQELSWANPTEETENNISFPEHYENEINAVKFATKVEVESTFSQDSLYKSTAKAQRANLTLATSFFGEEEKIGNQWKETVEDENGEKIDTWYAEFKNGSTVYVDKGSVTYSTKFFDNIYRAFHFGYNENLYSKENTFEFNTPDECVDAIVADIENLGYILDDFKYVYYALDHETMKAQENLVYKEGGGGEIGLDGSKLTYKDTWTSDDDCYYFCIQQKHQGLPVYFGSNYWKEDSDENMPVQAVYSANGIERLDVVLLTPLYLFSQNEERIKLLPFEDMINLLAHKFGNILTENTYTVTRATLYQMPISQKDGSYIVQPAWLFETEETGTDVETKMKFVHTIITLIDAQTGRELYP